MHDSLHYGRVISKTYKKLKRSVIVIPVFDIKAIGEIDSKNEIFVFVKFSPENCLRRVCSIVGKTKNKIVLFMASSFIHSYVLFYLFIITSVIKTLLILQIDFLI
jgi:hypothetical protein